jgi:anti-sigma factor RsiW
MTHPESERFSAYLDGLAPDGEALELEEHLAACDECHALLNDLSELQRMARDLTDQFPPKDLWPGIARAIRRDATQDAEVIRLYPGFQQPAEPAPRTFRLSLPQAAAAGLVLAVLSGALGLRMGSAPAQEAVVAVEAQASWVSLVGEASPGLVGSAREVAQLEQILQQHDAELDPATIRILEKNLGVIDRAIRESVAALMADPGNRFLEGHLERAIQAKGDYLRTAALLMAPVS